MVARKSTIKWKQQINHTRVPDFIMGYIKMENSTVYNIKEHSKSIEFDNLQLTSIKNHTLNGYEWKLKTKHTFTTMILSILSIVFTLNILFHFLYIEFSAGSTVAHTKANLL